MFPADNALYCVAAGECPAPEAESTEKEKTDAELA
jgi:hypothetical protein